MARLAGLALLPLSVFSSPLGDSSVLLQTSIFAGGNDGQTPTCQPAPFDAPFGTNCPQTSRWLDEMVKADPEPGKFFMDVGCNKGDDAVELLERWDASPSHYWSKERWMQQLSAEHPVEHACGLPGMTFAKTAVVASGERQKPSMVCVEPMTANFDLLTQVSAALGYGAGGAEGALHLVQAAMLDAAKPGQTVVFPEAAAGVEDQGLKLARQTVNLTTVDQLVTKLALPRLDILRIDTEGADPLVLKGAKKVLETVRYLEFEVHRDLVGTAWEETSLYSVVQELAEQSFECYWAGNEGALYSLNDCWQESFERGYWANAVCAKRGDVWAAVLRKFAKP